MECPLRCSPEMLVGTGLTVQETPHPQGHCLKYILEEGRAEQFTHLSPLSPFPKNQRALPTSQVHVTRLSTRGDAPLQSALPRPVVNFSAAACLANGQENRLGLHPCLSAQAAPPLPGLGEKPRPAPAARLNTLPLAPVCPLPRTCASAVGFDILFHP